MQPSEHPVDAGALTAAPRPPEPDAIQPVGVESLLVQLVVLVVAVAVGAAVARSAAPAMRPVLLAVGGGLAAVVLVGALVVIRISDSGLSITLGFAALVLASAALFGSLAAGRRLLAARKAEEG